MAQIHPNEPITPIQIIFEKKLLNVLSLKSESMIFFILTIWPIKINVKQSTAAISQIHQVAAKNSILSLLSFRQSIPVVPGKIMPTLTFYTFHRRPARRPPILILTVPEACLFPFMIAVFVRLFIIQIFLHNIFFRLLDLSFFDQLSPPFDKKYYSYRILPDSICKSSGKRKGPIVQARMGPSCVTDYISSRMTSLL